ncbi:hypothetical protein L9F63_014247 [Diploptera punctata]|uniref:Gustatory receptor n=1 Tax=Diploptera punctata TaxID=6984 RepID=A0AAD8A8Y3_DIPPU|nr:hypothetical protein L9F63_014247 [Diploptera punctata]
MSSDLNCFHQPLQPIFLLIKVFGLFPFKLSFNAVVMLNSSRKELFLPTVWFFVVLAAGCYSLTRYFNVEMEDKIFKGVCIAYYCFLGLTALSSITAMWFNRKKVKDIFRNLFAVDQLLDKRTTLILYKQTRSSSVKRMSFVFFFITTVTACLIYYYFGNFLDVMLGVCESTLITINSMFIFQYVTFVQGIRTRYYQLWKNLKTCTKKRKKQISILRQQHFHLSTVVSLLNYVYGFTMLLLVMTTLSDCVVCLYDGINILKRDEDPIQSVSAILIGTFMFIPVLWVVTSCHQAVHQNENQMTSIQELLISKSVNHKTQNELKELLLQINLMRPMFSAGGFFTLNLQFVCTLFSSIFTYIIIMSQIK